MEDRSVPSFQGPSSRLEEIFDSSARIEELSESDADYEDMGVATPYEEANIAYINSVCIPIKDEYVTESSKVQDETAEIILPFLEGNPNDFTLNTYGIPQLQRERHARMLKKILGNYPGRFAMMDASRPWIVYWGLQSMTALGLDIHPYQKRYVTLSICSH